MASPAHHGQSPTDSAAVATPLPEPPARLVAELSRAVAGEVRFDAASRWLYATDASIYAIPPLGVVVPRTPAAVAQAVAVCAAAGVAIHPRGAGTGLAGGCLGDGVVIDLSRYLPRIDPIDPEARSVTVEAGVVLDDLNRAAAAHRLGFGPDPATSSRCTIGGMVNTNATGAHSLVYGTTRDHLLTVAAIGADGAPLAGRATSLAGAAGTIAAGHARAIRDHYPPLARRVAGYCLDALLAEPAPRLESLLAGSEGTLAITTAATLRLVAWPAARAVGVVVFDDVGEAMAAVETILSLAPAALEHLDRPLLAATAGRPAFAPLRAFLGNTDPASLLAVEFFGKEEAEVDDRLAALAAALPNHRLIPRRTPAEQADLWTLRRAGLGLLMGRPGDAKAIAFIEDAAVPVARLPEYVAGIRALLAEHHLSASLYGHAGAGLLHIRPRVDLHTGDGRRQLREVAAAAATLAGSLAGTVSGEHGDGLLRSEWLPALYGAEVMAALREVKRLFDPHGLLNPGRITADPPPPMDRRLRYPDPPPPLPATPLAFRRDGGWRQALEQCNGCGGCRQHVATMCPTYLATGDEQLATRGRANLLRADAFGQLPGGGADPTLSAALSSCLACKGCQIECSAGVDMALLKAAWLDHQRGGRPPTGACRWLATPHRLLDGAAPFAPVANWLAARRPGRWLAARAGIDPRRQLPHLAPGRLRRAIPAAGPRGRVVLWHDCLDRNLEGAIGRAALALLTAAGFAVAVVEQGCCGRPAFSQGALAIARELAAQAVARLAPFAERGAPIVVLEPSCASMLGGDLLELIDSPEAAAVAAAVTPLESLLLPVVERGDLPLSRSTAELLLHPHCHDRLAGDPTASRALLGRCGALAETAAGCCGMAGAFGYQATHYDLSVAVARRLVAALAAAPAAVVVASGTSCRAQIRDLTGRAACHPAVVLAQAAGLV